MDEVVFCYLRNAWLTWVSLPLTYQGAWFSWVWVPSPLKVLHLDEFHRLSPIRLLHLCESLRLSLIRVLNLHESPRFIIFQLKEVLWVKVSAQMMTSEFNAYWMFEFRHKHFWFAQSYFYVSLLLVCKLCLWDSPQKEIWRTKICTLCTAMISDSSSVTAAPAFE